MEGWLDGKMSEDLKRINKGETKHHDKDIKRRMESLTFKSNPA